MAYYAYCRVSGLRQKKDGTIAEQIRPMKKWLIQHGVPNTKRAMKRHLFHEQFTGMTMHRPVFDELVKKLKPGDTLGVYKLSRLARSARKCDNFIHNHKDIRIVIVKSGYALDWHTSMGKFTIRILLSVVELDHDMTVDRLKAGRLNAKRKGNANWHGGPPKRIDNEKKRPYFVNIYKFNTTHTNRETARAYNCSIRTVQRVKHDLKRYYQKKYKAERNPNQTELVKGND